MGYPVLLRGYAQSLQNSIQRSTAEGFVLTIPKERLQLVSATPTLNKMGDIRNLVRLLAENAKLPIKTAPVSVRQLLEDVYDPFDVDARDEAGERLESIWLSKMDIQQTERKKELWA